MSGLIPPFLFLMSGAVLIPALRGWARDAAVLGLPLLSLGAVLAVPDGPSMTTPFLDHLLVIVEGDNLSRLFGVIFSLMAFGGGLFALRQNRVVELAAAFAYAGGAVGVAFAGDLISVFVFWEVMALGSTLVIWSAGTEASRRSAFRYLQIHLLGGVLLMAGIVGYVADTGSIVFEAMNANTLATGLMLAGFLINAGAPPLSAWLPDAYPEASHTGTVFLSAFTTKIAVYVLLRGFPGTEILIPIGLFMVFYGIIYALLENDMRRILAYSIVNQVGFMVTGIGIGTEMALNGAAAHAFTHIIYKGLLLMSAGSVLYMTGGKRKCTDLGGLFQSMPITMIAGVIGALAISSFPWTSGFVSKSMISQAAADESLAWVWYLLMAASAGVFLHAGIKFPWFVFFQKDSGLRPDDPPRHMQAAMVLFAFLCIAIGVYPQPLYEMLPYAVDYVPYTVSHVLTMLQLLLFAGLAFFVLLPLMRRTLTLTLDVDWFYRVPAKAVARATTQLVSALLSALYGGAEALLDKMNRWTFRHHGPGGLMERTHAVGVMALWVVVLLAAYLLVYFLKGA